MNNGSTDEGRASGPLQAIRVLEFAGLGPTPFAAMMLADMGADIIRIDRPGMPLMSAGDPKLDTLNRGRPSLALDLKSKDAITEVRQLVAKTDVVLEGFRPGVMEKLGLGPDELTAINPKLIYARMTGWGQTGPLAHKAGHDINYLALTGGLQMMGSADRPPPPPLNLVGDFGGGGMFAVAGILAALVERASSNLGQVVDIAMVDGVSILLAQAYAWRAMGFWTDERGQNLLDGGAYFYRCYETSDGRYLAVGAIEPQFHACFITGLGLKPTDFCEQMYRRHWPERALLVAKVIASKSLDEWDTIFAPLDACVTPVLTPSEAMCGGANVERAVFHESAPNPAPRFSRSTTAAGKPSVANQGGVHARKRWI